MADNNSSRGLLNKDSAEAEVDKSIAKIIILAIVWAAFSFLFSYFLRLFILNGRSDFLLFSFLASLVFLSIFLLTALFIKSAWKINLIIFLNVLFLAAPFFDRLSGKINLGLLISFLFLVWANYNGRQELNNTLKIKFWRISKKTIPKAIIALAVFVGFVYVGVVGSGTKGFFISQATFEKVVSPITQNGLVQKLLPGLDLSLSTGDLIQNLATNQVEQNSQFDLLSQSDKSQLINQSIEDLESEASSLVGAPLDLKARASDELYKIVAAKFDTLSPNVAPTTIPIVVAALIFLTIVGLSLPIRLVTSALAFLVYEICLALGFSVIMLEGRSREIIILK